MGHVQDALVVGVGVDGGHVADLDAKFVLQHQGHGGKAVGRARGVGHDVVFGRIVILMVDAHDDGDVFFLGRSGDDDLFGPVFNVDGALGSLAEYARAFHHNVHAVLAPGKLLGVALGEAVYLPVAHGHFSAVDLGVQIGAPVNGVVFQQVKVGFSVKKVVDGHHFHAVAVALVQGAKNLPADAAKAIDAYSDFAHMRNPHKLEGSVFRRRALFMRETPFARTILNWGRPFR